MPESANVQSSRVSVSIWALVGFYGADREDDVIMGFV
jgi:hypothetical protein